MTDMKDNRASVKEGDLHVLRNRINIKVGNDPTRYNEISLRRYLKAFETPDKAQAAILETEQWRTEMKIAELSSDHPDIKWFCDSDKARVLDHKDVAGRPIIYISSQNYTDDDRKMKQLTQFVAYCLEELGKKCSEEVIDNFCIVFDLKNINLDCIDYQIIKLLVWELSRYYPERLGVCIFLKAPMLFEPAWTKITKWIDKHTLNKIFFVNSEEELSKFLQPSILNEPQEEP